MDVDFLWKVTVLNSLQLATHIESEYSACLVTTKYLQYFHPEKGRIDALYWNLVNSSLRNVLLSEKLTTHTSNELNVAYTANVFPAKLVLESTLQLLIARFNGVALKKHSEQADLT